uniref:TNFR-Cys domain-containing protein n=1 Tax=Acanthochromis polyacanthus TaxID=80966 RepID=A0A3Q1GKH3_9TELE
MFSGSKLTFHLRGSSNQTFYFIVLTFEKQDCVKLIILFPPGSRVKTDCSEFRSTSCLSCPHGTFMDKLTGLKECFPCTNCDEDLGLKVKTSCTTTSDTVCEPLEGFYCIDPIGNNCAAARKHRICHPGQYINQTGWYFW